METVPNASDRSSALQEIVEEGVDARNVLSWRVPNEPSPLGKLRLSSEKRQRKKRNSLSDSCGASSGRVHRMNALAYETGSDSQSEDSRSHFQSRLWRFLFSNITRAVDELYNLCEDENNREYCLEGIKLFEGCKNDFHKLIERMEDQKRFEDGGQVGGVSWEVRKSSSGKRRVLSSGGGRHQGHVAGSGGENQHQDQDKDQEQEQVLQTPPPSSPQQHRQQQQHPPQHPPQHQSTRGSQSVLSSRSADDAVAVSGSSTSSSSHESRETSSLTSQDTAPASMIAPPPAAPSSSKLRPTAAPFTPLVLTQALTIAPGLPASLPQTPQPPPAAAAAVAMTKEDIPEVKEGGVAQICSSDDKKKKLAAADVASKPTASADVEAPNVATAVTGVAPAVANASAAPAVAQKNGKTTAFPQDVVPSASERAGTDTATATATATATTTTTESPPSTKSNGGGVGGGAHRSPAAATKLVVTPPPGMQLHQHPYQHQHQHQHQDDDPDPVESEVERETEKVWAQAEAWLEAEMQAEEDAWRLIRSGSDGSDGSGGSGGRGGRGGDSRLGLLAGERDDESSSILFDEDRSSQQGEREEKSGDRKTALPFRALSSSSLSIDTCRDESPEDLRPPPLHPMHPQSSARPSAAAAVAVGHQHQYQHQHCASGNTSPISYTSSLTYLDDPYSLDDFSLSPTKNGPRTLHEKLSSPERYKRNRLTPEEARQRSEERQVVAELNRDKTVEEKKLRAQVASSRVKARESREAERVAQGKESYAEKLKEAGKRHNEHIKVIRGKAGNENAKVSEIVFINSLTQQNFDDELQKKLVDTEARIMAGRRRREELLDNITVQQRKRNSRKSQQMSENRLNLEKLKMERWEKLQTRLDTVRRRREERLAELQRRSALELKTSADCTAPSSPPSRRQGRPTQGEASPLGSASSRIPEENSGWREAQSARGVSLEVKCSGGDDWQLLDSIIAEERIRTCPSAASSNSAIPAAAIAQVTSTKTGRMKQQLETRPCFKTTSTTTSAAAAAGGADAAGVNDNNDLMKSVITQYQTKINQGESFLQRQEFFHLVADRKAKAEAARLESRGGSGKKKKKVKSKKTTNLVDATDEPAGPATSPPPPPAASILSSKSSAVLQEDSKSLEACGEPVVAVAAAEAITLLRQTVQKIQSGKNRQVITKKCKQNTCGGGDGVGDVVKIETEPAPGPPAAPLRLLDVALIRKTLEVFVPDKSSAECYTAALRSVFLTHGGVELCCELLNSKTGFLSHAQPLDLSDRNHCSALCSVFAIVQGSLLYSSPAHKEKVSDNSPDVSMSGGEAVMCLDDRACEQMFASGLALHLVDTLQVLLMALSLLCERKLLPAVLPAPGSRCGGHASAHTSGSSGNSKHPASKSAPSATRSRAPDGSGGSTTGPIDWPDFLSDMIFPLFAIHGHLCEYIKTACQFSADAGAGAGVGAGAVGAADKCLTDSSDLLCLRWLLCLSSSGLLETTSTLFQQLQCVAGQCAVDRDIFRLLCTTCRSFTAMATSIRALRLAGEEAGSHGLVLDMSALYVPVSAPDAPLVTPRDLLLSLYLCTSRELAAQCVTSHLVSLLGALLLQDASRASSRGRREEAPPTPTPTPTRSFGSPQGTGGQADKPTFLPVPILIVCHELLATLNSLCCFDLETAQKLPQDLKASSALIAERVLIAVFPLIELARRPQRLPEPPPPVLNLIRAKTARAKGTSKSSSSSSSSSSATALSLPFPASLRPLTVANLEDIVHQLLMYLGYLSLNCPENQAFAAVGTPPTLLVRLCTFPIMYFSDERLKQQLLPALICSCFLNDHNLCTIRQEMSPTLLRDLLGRALEEKRLLDGTLTSSGSSGSGSGSVSLQASRQFLRSFSLRFPVKFWAQAFEYFGGKLA